jgi:outer membrane protein assembly factor BamA
MRRRNTPRRESHQARAWNSQLNPHPLRYKIPVAPQAKRCESLSVLWQQHNGATIQFDMPLTEQLGMQYRYSIYNQDVTLDRASLSAAPSLPIQQAALAGPAWVCVGSTVSYNTLDNAKNPTSGIKSQLKQDLAGLRGDVKAHKLRTSTSASAFLSSPTVGLQRQLSVK